MLVYALGGGRGHAVRGSTLALALRDNGADATVLVRGEASAVPRALAAPFVAVARPASATALRTAVLRRCAELDITDLVVDTFPEGLLGELAVDAAGPPRVALLRVRTTCGGKTFRAGLARTRLAIDLEPHLQWCPPDVHAEQGAPFTRLHLQRVPGGEHRLDVLAVASDPELVPLLRVVAGRIGRAGLRVGLVADGRVRSNAFDEPASLLAPDLLRTPVIIGPAGFNLTYEAIASGAWHIAVPRPRPHDDQHRRASAVARVVRGPHALERLAVHLATTRPPPPQPVPVVTASDVARRILGLSSTVSPSPPRIDTPRGSLPVDSVVHRRPAPRPRLQE